MLRSTVKVEICIPIKERCAALQLYNMLHMRYSKRQLIVNSKVL